MKIFKENGLGNKYVLLRRLKFILKLGFLVRSYGIFDLFINSIICIIIFIMVVSWFVNSYVYYGLLLNVKNFGGNMYVNFVLVGLVEIFFYLLIVFFFNWSGRRKFLFYFMMGVVVLCWVCMKL